MAGLKTKKVLNKMTVQYIIHRKNIYVMFLKLYNNYCYLNMDF